ncbi:integral membrane protein [Colletotrichum kahawae]|uniref:Integral membrane protein n=1 Tax=Colletotrichum kahawae TaxID=34407 RepID=A0AAD9Y5M7_COLKA|nr:integral membrane protein [Colletotrichum kahawae]
MSSPVGAAPPPQGVVPHFANPTDVLHTINLVSQILSIVSVSIFMMIRCYVKWAMTPPFHIDDCKHTLSSFRSCTRRATALVSEFSPQSNIRCLTDKTVVQHYGGGYHVYEISKESLVGFKKLTLLLIVIRVFGTYKKTVIATYAVIVFMVGYYAPVLVIKTLICRPIAGFWDPDLPADCFNQRAVFVADTAVSAVTDLAVLTIPIPVAVTLRMSWSKRLKVLAMLSAGGIATAASIVRMILVVQLQKSNDEPVDFIRFNLLGTAEVSIGMICACLPAVNILVMRRHDFTPNSSGAMRNFFAPMELKFLKGSKLQTQHLTGVLRTSELGMESSSVNHSEQISQGTQVMHEPRDFIFPFERLSRIGSVPLRNPELGRPDSWYTKVTSPTFSGPSSPDWARKGADEGIRQLESGDRRDT